jgi:hypothetical protein
MPSTNPVDYGADPCGLRNSAWAINECLNLTGKCHFPVGTFLIGSSPGAKITSRSRAGGVASFTTSTPHGLVVGEKITLYGFSDATFNFDGNPPSQYGFRVESTPTDSTFTAAVPGANSGLVIEDGWINLVGGGFNSSIILGYFSATNNVEIIGQGVGQTTLKFADHTSTKRRDLYGVSVDMIKTIGTVVGYGTVGAPGSQAGVPTGATNCKNTLVEGITFDGNYRNNSVADVKIVSVQRTNGINTYTVDKPLFSPTEAFTQFWAVAPPAYSPPIPPPYTNVSNYNQYISNVLTTGPSTDSTFTGTGQIVNVTSLSFQRDLRVVLIYARRNEFNKAIYTRHPNWYFPFTIGNSFTVTGFADASLNGTFVVEGFLSFDEVYCANIGATTGKQINGIKRSFGVATYDTIAAHGFIAGQTVLVTGLSNSSFNGTFVITGTPSATQFTCSNAGAFLGPTPENGYAYLQVVENARAWSAPDVALTPQTNAGVNSVYTVSGINHTGEKALIQDNRFYDFGVGTFNAESFVIMSFLPMTVDNETPGARVLKNSFGYAGSNSIQSTLYPGSAEAVTEIVVGGYSSLLNPINIISRSAGVATYTCVMKHTLRVGDVVAVSGFADPTFNGTWVVLGTPDSNKFTAVTGGSNLLPAVYLDGSVTMLRPRRIFAADCVIEENTFVSGPIRTDSQSPLHATTFRETIGGEVRYNNFNGYIGTCFYVDTFHHEGTRIHNNTALDVASFIALTVQDYYPAYLALGYTPAQAFPYSVFTSAHRNMVIENNDVLLTGPDSWYYQTAFPPIDAVFLNVNHDVNKSPYYYPTDYQIPVTSGVRATGVTTFTTASAHELQTGMQVTVLGTSDATFTGQFVVLSTPTITTFTVANPGTNGTSLNGFLGINSPIQFPWEIRPIGYQRTGGVATYTTNKAHQMAVGYHAVVEGLSNASFNDEVIVTGTPTLYTFTCASPGPDVPFTSETGNFFRYIENIQIGCNTVRRLSGQSLAVNNGGKFSTTFSSGRSTGCVAPLDQFFYFDCPEGCLALECDPGPCKPNDYIYRI